MAGIDKNTLFCLTGESFSDSSYNNINITNTGLTEANIEDEEIEGQPIKCINFNTTNGYLTFNLDDSFLNNAWTIDWWEKDSATYPGLSGLFTNMTASSGNYFGIGKYTEGKRTFVNMAQGGSYFIQTEAIGDDNYDIWVHKSIVFNGISTYSIYVNGRLYKTITNTNKAYNNKQTFQMGRWRVEKYALHRKIYNFRVSSCMRYNDNFTPQVEPYEVEDFTLDEVDYNTTLRETTETLVKVAYKIASDIQPIIGKLTNESNKADKKNNIEIDFNEAIKCKEYNVIQTNGIIKNSPVINGDIIGILKVVNTNDLIHQTLETSNGKTFKRMLNNNEWTEWKTDDSNKPFDKEAIDILNETINLIKGGM